MPARKMPPVSEIEHMVARGMTHAQIAQAIYRDHGLRVSRSTVSAYLHRHGKTRPAKKYVMELPWIVRDEHTRHYAARMLRLLGRRNQGIRNSQEADQRLDSWLTKLRESGSVVVYVPETPEGFFYVKDVPPDSPDIPISTVEL